MKPTPDTNNFTNDILNESHLGRKKKAIENKFQKKNIKQIIALLDEEDAELAKTYARYVK